MLEWCGLEKIKNFQKNLKIYEQMFAFVEKGYIIGVR